MSDSFIQVPQDSTGKKIDAEQVTVGANDVQRQRVELAGAAATAIVQVLTTNPGTSDYGLVTRDVNAADIITKLTTIDSLLTTQLSNQWHTTGNQSGLTGTKSGTFALTTEGALDVGDTRASSLLVYGQARFTGDVSEEETDSPRLDVGVLSDTARIILESTAYTDTIAEFDAYNGFFRIFVPGSEMFTLSLSTGNLQARGGLMVGDPRSGYQVFDSLGFLHPTSDADETPANNSIYVSDDTNILMYKDGSGVPHALYVL